MFKNSVNFHYMRVITFL